MNHLCIGCGICATACPTKRIEMFFNKNLGNYQPSDSMETCEKACGICEKVCPFVPENPTIVEITRNLYANVEGIQHNDVLGYYQSSYVGYSTDHRFTSASGGLATWVLESLLIAGMVDHVICVGQDEESPTLFSFRICSTIEQIRACSGSCYQPLELSKALQYVMENEGRYAIVALPCVAKGLRLAMLANRHLNNRIEYIFGLTCGQNKSRHFVDYIAEHHIGLKNPSSIQFRVKDPNRHANNYLSHFNYRESSGNIEKHDVSWSEGISRIWVNRWFTLEACDYCDDIFAETADAVFMDAWLSDYANDCDGTSLAVIRDSRVDTLIRQGMTAKKVCCEDISPEKVLESQKNRFVQKRILSGCHVEATSSALRLPSLRYNTPSDEYRKLAFIKRNTRRCLHEGFSPFTIKLATLFTSSWGWRIAKVNLLLTGITKKVKQQVET